jgi:hypothetical protein
MADSGIVESMEERRESRYPAKTPATLHLLSEVDLSVGITVITDISRSGIRAECAQFLPHGSPVSLEIEDLTVLGGVENCTEIRSGSFGVGISISHVLPRLQHSD